jgi:acyl-coenzyme A thioesterase PaaI-like protein
MPGSEKVTAEGPPPRPPFFVANDLRVINAGGGAAKCETDVLPWLAGAAEMGIHAAVAGLLDSALSYAATTCALPDTMMVTLGMRVHFWTPPPACSRRVARVNVTLLDGQGRVTARLSETSILAPWVRPGTQQHLRRQ